MADSRYDDLKELIETGYSTVKALTFRNLLIIFILGLMTALGFTYTWLLKPDNRGIIIDAVGQTKVVGVVGNCPVIKFPFRGTPQYAVVQNYRNTVGSGYFISAIVQEYNTEKIDKICDQLHTDRLQIIGKKYETNSEK